MVMFTIRVLLDCNYKEGIFLPKQYKYMKTRFFSSFILSTALITLQAQAPNIQWQNSFGGTTFEYASDVLQTNDGGYLVVGSSGSNDGDIGANNGGTDVWVVKLNAAGALDWEATYGGSDDEQGFKASEIPGGFLIAGETRSNDGDVTGNHGEKDAWVFAIDSIGTLLIQKTFGGTQWESFQDIKATSDGGSIAIGFSESNNGDLTTNNGLVDVWVVKLDDNIEIEWQKSFGGSNDDIGEAIVETADGDLIFSARSRSNDGDVSGNHAPSTDDFWTVKLDVVGNVIWQTANGGALGEHPRSLVMTDDGGCQVLGSAGSNDGDVSSNPGFPASMLWLIKLDQNGSLEWEATYGGTAIDQGYDMDIASNGDLLIVGGTNSADGDVSSNNGSQDLWALRTDMQGVLLWETALGGSAWDGGFGMNIGVDQQMIVVGSSSSNNGDVTGNNGNEDVWVAKLEADAVGISEENPAYFSIHPNPSSGILRLELLEAGRNNEMILADAFGRNIMAQQMHDRSIVLDLSEFAKGIYIVTMRGDDGVWSKRLVLE